MKKILALVLTAAMLATTLVACSTGKTEQNTVSTGDSSSVSEATKAKDTLNVAITSEPPSLTTVDHDSLIAVNFNLLTYNSLYKIDHATLQPVPDLASEYSVDETGTIWTFKLKEGVTFHDGSAFTSSDVVASLEYAKTIPGSSLYTQNFQSIEAPDEYTVVITTPQPYAGLLFDLGYHYNFIMPEELIGNNDFNANPVGTGPYILKDWVYGNTMTFEANENYFDTENKAQIKNLIFSIIPEGATRTIALESDQVDFVWDVSGADISSLKANENVEILEVNTVDNVILFLNNDKKPYDNTDFRNAINYAINREDVIVGAMNGLGVPSYSAIPSGYWGYSDEKAPEYNLEKAKEYLKAWGGDPASVTIPILCSNESRVAVATIIQSNLVELGIGVEIVPMDTATYFSRWQTGDYEALVGSWSPSNSLTYVQRYHSDRSAGYPGCPSDPALDELVIEVAKIIDEDERLAKITEIVGYVNELSPQVSLYQSVWIRAFDKELEGVVCSATGYTAFNEMYWA